MLKPDYVYEVVGEAEVLQLFDYNQGRERVAGCRVNTGVLHRTSAGGSGTTASDGSVNKTRVLRQGVKVYEGGMKAV